VCVARKEGFSIDAQAMLDAVSDRTKIVLVYSPNNPTGNTESYDVVKASLCVGRLGCCLFSGLSLLWGEINLRIV